MPNKALNVAMVAEWTQAQLHALSGDANSVLLTGATQDSRKVTAGQLFIALPGEFADGHDYVAQAAANGAAAALVARKLDCDIPQLVVADVEQALQVAATEWRKQLDTEFVAVTGSCGKTTVKQMMAAIFAEVGPTLATAGNLNNHLGVPMTVLGVSPEHQFAVIEMGASAIGDIALLCQIAQPRIAVITMVAEAHLEGFGSIENTAKAKGEIFAALGEQGVAVMNADEPWLNLWLQQSTAGLSLSFGKQALADVSVSADHCQSWAVADAAGSRFVMNLPSGSVDINLPLPGWHNVMNAAAAATVAAAVGVSAEAIARGLNKAHNVAGRLAIQQMANGATVVDDSYNANPASVLAGAEWLLSLEQGGEAIVALGEMAELGEEGIAIHRQLGLQLRELGIHQLFTVGDQAAAALAAGFGGHAQCFTEHADLVAALKAALKPADAVLIKGSRSAAMEKVVAGLIPQAKDLGA